MDENILELVAKILQVITYMAGGGLLSLIFFFAFAPSLLGINKMQQQLNMIEKENRDSNRLLMSIEAQLKILNHGKGDSTQDKSK